MLFYYVLCFFYEEDAVLGFTVLFLKRDESFATFQQKGRSLDDGEHCLDILTSMLLLISLISLLLFDVSESQSFLRDLSFDLRKYIYTILTSN